ncbi:hypothetical protein M0802_006346 [Mischocyttarus mexicanus]|nr:hypothetical protein M0802_006346 [Mischocyttarus mexicanus]
MSTTTTTTSSGTPLVGKIMTTTTKTTTTTTTPTTSTFAYDQNAIVTNILWDLYDSFNDVQPNYLLITLYVPVIALAVTANALVIAVVFKYHYMRRYPFIVGTSSSNCRKWMERFEGLRWYYVQAGKKQQSVRLHEGLSMT